MDKIQAKALPSNLTPAPGQSVRYRLLPLKTSSVSFDALCERVATASGRPVSEVRYMAERINQMLIDLLGKNARVHTGLYVASLGIGGSLGAMTDQPNKVDNPVHAVLTPEGQIVDILKAIEVENMTVTVAALINEFAQSGLGEMNKITLANTNIVVNGANIKIRSDKADEFACLVDIATGTLVKTATIVESDAARLVCKFASLPTTAGTYRFEIHTRNANDEMDVTTVSRNVVVAPAAA